MKRKKIKKGKCLKRKKIKKIKCRGGKMMEERQKERLARRTAFKCLKIQHVSPYPKSVHSNPSALS